MCEAKNKEEIEKKIDEKYHESVEYTKIISTICRQLAFAEGAVLWFLEDKFHISISVMIGCFCALILYFTFDIIQYLIGHIKYSNKGKELEEKYHGQEDYNINNYKNTNDFNKPIEILLYIKLIFIALASFLLLIGFFQSVLYIYCSPTF